MMMTLPPVSPPLFDCPVDGQAWARHRSFCSGAYCGRKAFIQSLINVEATTLLAKSFCQSGVKSSTGADTLGSASFCATSNAVRKAGCESIKYFFDFWSYKVTGANELITLWKSDPAGLACIFMA